MKKFKIIRKESGVNLGVYEGENELEAYQNMLQDQGYSVDNCEENSSGGWGWYKKDAWIIKEVS